MDFWWCRGRWWGQRERDDQAEPWLGSEHNPHAEGSSPDPAGDF